MIRGSLNAVSIIENDDSHQYIATIYSIDMGSGNIDVVKNYLLGYDTDNWYLNYNGRNNFTYSSSEDSIYFAYQAIPNDLNSREEIEHKLVKLAPNSSAIEVVVNNALIDGLNIAPVSIRYTPHGLLILNNYYFRNNRDLSMGLLSFDGDSYLKYFNLEEDGFLSFTYAEENNLVYYLVDKYLKAISLVDGHEVLSIALQAVNEKFLVHSLWGLQFNARNNSLVGRAFDTIKEIDIDSGLMSTLITNGLGSGPPLGFVSEIDLDVESNTLFGTDSGNPARLYKVNLNTSDREVLAELYPDEDDYGYLKIEDVFFDRESNFIYLIFNDKILKKHIEDEEFKVLTDNSIATGPLIYELKSAALDNDGNRLFAVNYPDAIIAIDLNSGTRSLISKSEVKGEGEGFEAILGIDIDKSKNTAYVSDDTLGVVFEVNIDSGDRKILSEKCNSIYGDDYLNPYEGLDQVIFNEFDASIYVVARRLLKLDPITSECSASQISSVFDIGFTSENQLIGSSKYKIIQHSFDLTEDSDEVTISK
ncbi:hypothetical protein [Microbulbifer sp. JTAC008]|uniref:hypothetical protein n=1 Tax=unclassified Microbulbifer TaxID=2619833 RepID=UPI0040396688